MDQSTKESSVKFKYAINHVLEGHAADVRAVAPSLLSTGGFYTGSRDQLVKLWLPTENGSYNVINIFTGPTKFVACLCSLPPGGNYPAGLVLAGSNDCAIYGFSALAQMPIMKLMGHSNVVCALYAGEGLFVSGSWDKTAKVWSGQQCLYTLYGHDQAVWAVLVYPVQNLIVTGSADRTIKIWRQGNCENTLFGHTDVVRALALTKQMNILSCANDGTVREWDIKGNTLQVIQCHENYIYGLTLLNNGMDFATCGEDEQVKIWKKGRCVQTLSIKSKTLWSIACIGEDLVVGCSDGTVCIIGKTEVTDTGMEGDTEESVVSSCNPDGNSNRIDFESKYTSVKKDFEFYIEIEGNMFVMAVDKTEDPYEAALRFITTHGINPNHVPEIVDFIVKHRDENVPLGLPLPNAFFPTKTYYTYFNGNIDGLKSKLLEFTECVPKAHYIRPEKIEKLVLVVSFPEDVSEEQMQYLDRVIMWSDEFLFPALDLLRLAVKCKGIGTRIGNENFTNHLLDIVKNTKKDVNRTLAIKIFCNLFVIAEGEELLMKNQAKICDSVKESLYEFPSSHKAAASLYLNYAVAGYKGLDVDVDQYCMNVMEMLRIITDPDSLHKLFVAIGTLCVCNKMVYDNFGALNLTDALMECTKYLEKSRDTMNVLRSLMQYFQHQK